MFILGVDTMILDLDGRSNLFYFLMKSTAAVVSENFRQIDRPNMNFGLIPSYFLSFFLVLSNSILSIRNQLSKLHGFSNSGTNFLS